MKNTAESADGAKSVKKLGLFSGRATRCEFWKRNLPFYGILAVALILRCLPFMVGTQDPLELLVNLDFYSFKSLGVLSYVVGVLDLAIFASALVAIPSRARRYHDLGISGWMVAFFMLFMAVPVTGFTAGGALFELLLLGCVRGQFGANRFGPDASGAESENRDEGSFTLMIETFSTWIHAVAARYVGGSIAWFWKYFSKLAISARMCIGFVLLALSLASVGFFISHRYVERARFSQENLRVLREAGLVATVSEQTAEQPKEQQEENKDEAQSEKSETSAGESESAAPDAPAVESLPESAPTRGDVERYEFLAYGASAACLLIAVLLFFLKGRVFFVLMEAVFAAWLLVAFNAIRIAFTVPSVLCAADYKQFDKLSRNAIWTESLFWFVPLMVLALMVLLAMSVSTVRRRYGVGSGSTIGDRVFRDFRTGGEDPRYRTSWYWSIFLFVFIMIAPFLFQGGCEEPYGLIQGSGTPELQVVKVKKVKKEKKKKKYILNKWSPYILERAKIDDNKNLEELEVETQDMYVADQPAKKGGKLGRGGGKTGGWPKGLADAKVRFIRLEYSGGDWDQDMGKGADYNLLIKFHKITGFPIWKETESKPISRLSKFPKHYAPPFVFLTGSRGMNISNSDVQELRRYLIDEGGMLFIDNGGGGFGGTVRNLVSRIFPDKPFIDIPNDDPIFQQPYSFPDGAPPFWHHDGYRAKGVRVGDRLAVFYHPGDINDAWKDGHSGATEAVAEQAFRLGINVMYYAFNAYYARHFEGASDKK